MVNRRLLESTIIEMLTKNGAQDFPSILKSVKDRIEDVDEENLNRALMNLEVKGLLKVYSTAKDKQRIELARG
jgi:hypothetical protein